MNRNRTTTRRSLLACAALALAACTKEAGGGGSAAAAKAAELPASALLASAPAGAQPVKEARATAKSGDTVVVAGVVGETGKDAAFFTLVDASVKSCKEMEMSGDACKTPWDYCCEPPEELGRASATVEFRDGGKPRAGSVLGVHGLDHLVNVVVTGAAEKDASGNLTIVASGIYVRK